MRISLQAVFLHVAEAPQPLKSRQAILEMADAGDWRVHLIDLKMESLALLQEYLTSAESIRVSMASPEGERMSGFARVIRVSFGNTSGAVLQGDSSLQ